MKPLLLLLIPLFALLQRSFAQEANKDLPVTTVDIESIYPGGQPAWVKYLNHTLRYPDDAVSNEIKGTVIVQFIVNTDSTISDVHAVSGPKKGGLREESVRVISASGKWVPALKNGIPVKAYKKQPIVFQLEVVK